MKLLHSEINFSKNISIDIVAQIYYFLNVKLK